MSPTTILFNVLVLGIGLFSEHSCENDYGISDRQATPAIRIDITQMDGYERYLNDPKFQLASPMRHA